jgi:hypothetical protein
MHKRNDLVKFSWKANQDIVIPGFTYKISDELLFWPVFTHRYGFKKKTTYRVYLSEYLYESIRRICQERWPSQARLNWLNRRAV